jgi:signal transduction histidine kinase
MPAARVFGENGPVLKVPMAERLRTGIRWLRRPAGPLPRLTRPSQVFDAVLALILGITALDYVGNLDGQHPVDAGDVPPFFPVPPVPPARPPHDVLDIGGHGADLLVELVLLALVASAALAFRRRYPLAVLWVVLGAAMLTPDEAPRLTFYACVVAAYTAAAYGPYRVATLASLAAAVLVIGVGQNDIVPIVPIKYIPFLILIPIVVATNGLRRWKLRADEGSARLSKLERDQEEALRGAVEHERARIAGELHDVVTHNVSVMVIQAGAARKVMDADPGQAREALLAVEAGGRAAMAELRHVMGLLTMGTDGAVDLAPQPGLDQLEALVGRVRDTGVPVELTVTGRPRPVPSGVGLTAYRVVQEALTNTVKHAAGATAAVLVDYGGERLRVVVTDTGGSPSASAATGNGRGLIGLRERLAVYGGTLHAGRGPRGGYHVEALIPLEAA